MTTGRINQVAILFHRLKKKDHTIISRNQPKYKQANIICCQGIFGCIGKNGLSFQSEEHALAIMSYCAHLEAHGNEQQQTDCW